MNAAINTFVLVLASIFPGRQSARFRTGLSRIYKWRDTRDPRRPRPARRPEFVHPAGVLVFAGRLFCQFYGISIPILRVGGGFIVAVSGWKLLNEGSHKELENAGRRGRCPRHQAARSGLLSADAAIAPQLLQLVCRNARQERDWPSDCP